MAASYANVNPATVFALGLTEAEDGTYFKTFTGDSKRSLHEQMDETRDEIIAAGGEEIHRSKIGRNSPCWCGSGKKFKKCHLGN